MEHEQRIAELEDEIKQLRQRADDLRLERDKERALVAEMHEHVEDANDLIDRWIEAFDMVLNEKGEWCWIEGLNQRYEELHDKYTALRKDWNRFVPLYNAKVAPLRRNFGRPLAASDAQKADVLRRRKAGQSLRTIADETNLGLRTVRTIVDKANGVDRATLARLERIAPDRLADARERAIRRLRDSLPKQITEIRKRGSDLMKRAKGHYD